LTIRTGPFSLIRELLKYTSNVKSIDYAHSTLEIALDGFVAVTSKFLEGMKKSGFVFKSISNSIDPEFLEGDLHEFITANNEDDVPTFVCTTIRFRDAELPPLEHAGKSDVEISVNLPTQIEVNT
jgi:hypothetical protein